MSCISSVSPHVNHKHVDRGVKHVMLHTMNHTMEGERVAPAIKGAKEMRQASLLRNKHVSRKHEWQRLFCKKRIATLNRDFLPYRTDE